MRPVRRWREWSLQARMVVSIAALAAVGLIVANISGVLLLRSYLVERVDRQLSGQAMAVSRGGLPRFDPGGGRGTPDFGPPSAIQF